MYTLQFAIVMFCFAYMYLIMSDWTVAKTVLINDFLTTVEVKFELGGKRCECVVHIGFRTWNSLFQLFASWRQERKTGLPNFWSHRQTVTCNLEPWLNTTLLNSSWSCFVRKLFLKFFVLRNYTLSIFYFSAAICQCL